MVALAAAVVVVAVVVAAVVAVVAVAAEVETEGVGGRGIGSMLVVVVMSRCVWSPLALSRRILGGFVTVSVAAAVVVVEEEEVSETAGVGVVGLGLVGLSGSLDWVICLGGGDVALSGLDPALLSGLTGRLASLDCLFTTGFSS